MRYVGRGAHVGSESDSVRQTDIVGKRTVIKHAKWSELCELETLLTFLLPVRTFPCLHPVSLHPFLSCYSRVENGLEEVVREDQSVHSELTSGITMSHYILYK